MATRDEVAELRAEIARLRSPWRGLGSTAVFVAVLAIGFMALLVVFVVQPAILS